MFKLMVLEDVKGMLLLVFDFGVVKLQCKSMSKGGIIEVYSVQVWEVVGM